MQRRVLTPAEYETAFNEGLAAFKEHGEKAVSPYLQFCYDSIVDQTRASAWENGWWSGKNDHDAAEAKSRANLPPSVRLYGEPSPKGSMWVWESVETGRQVTVLAFTEMESLDRLRADELDIGQVKLADRYLPGTRPNA